MIHSIIHERIVFCVVLTEMHKMFENMLGVVIVWKYIELEEHFFGIVFHRKILSQSNIFQQNIAFRLNVY